MLICYSCRPVRAKLKPAVSSWVGNLVNATLVTSWRPSAAGAQVPIAGVKCRFPERELSRFMNTGTSVQMRLCLHLLPAACWAACSCWILASHIVWCCASTVGLKDGICSWLAHTLFRNRMFVCADFPGRWGGMCRDRRGLLISCQAGLVRVSDARKI